MIQNRQLVHYQIYTKNLSFLKMYRILKIMGVKNNKFHLVLFDKYLENVDPHNVDPNDYMTQARVMRECQRNFWYFIREVVRVTAPGADKGIPYTLHRGNLTMNYCMTRNISTYVELPRQNFKSISACVWYLWLTLFGTSNSQMMFATKTKEFAIENVERVKNIKRLLPYYLQYKEFSDTTGKELKQKEAVESLTNKVNNNKIVVIPSAKSATHADQLGRGATQPLQWYDEYAFIPHNEIVYGSASPAYSQASLLARQNNKPYGMLLTSTPGNMKEKMGFDAYETLSKSAKWDNCLFDMNSKEIDNYIKANGSTPFVYIRFMYYEIGRDEEWFKEQCRILKYKWDQIKREVLLEWNKTSTDCPFTEDELDLIATFVKQPIRTLRLMKYLNVDIYEEVNLREPQIIGVDVSGGYGKDNSAFVAISSKTTKVQAVFKNSKIGPTELSRVLYEYVTTYSPNALIVIERNSYGEAVIGNLKNTIIGPNLYYRIVKDDTKERTRDGFMMKSGTITKEYGCWTNRETRSLMYETLRDRINEHPDKFVSPILLDEISGLIFDPKSQRIDHSTTGHDDVVMAYNIAIHAYLYGTELHNFGIVKRDVLRFGESLGERIDDDITSMIIDPIDATIKNEMSGALLSSPKPFSTYRKGLENNRMRDLDFLDMEMGRSTQDEDIINSNKLNNLIMQANSNFYDDDGYTRSGSLIVDMVDDDMSQNYFNNTNNW